MLLFKLLTSKDAIVTSFRLGCSCDGGMRRGSISFKMVFFVKLTLNVS